MRSHSNLIGMGIIPLEFVDGQNSESLGLTGRERYTIEVPDNMAPRHTTQVKVSQQLQLSSQHIPAILTIGQVRLHCSILMAAIIA